MSSNQVVSHERVELGTNSSIRLVATHTAHDIRGSVSHARVPPGPCQGRLRLPRRAGRLRRASGGLRGQAVYDYVIVGAGSAGCVLASRLSENPDSRVLLLEAGPPDTADEIHIPAAVNLLFQTAYDWNYQTVPQDRAGGRSIYWPRGRVLGGSSSINAMIYIRGSRHDYDSWRDDYGCEGWGYTDLLPYFLRAESNSRGASAYHGASGPLSVQDLKFRSGLTGDFVAAARACGLPANDDFNGPEQDGVGYYQVTQKAGPPLVGCRRVPAPGGRPAEPDRLHRCPGHGRRDRGRPGDRRPLPAPRRGGAGQGRGRDHPVGWRHRQPAAAHALRGRPGRPPARAQHRGHGRERRVSAATCPITRS